MLTFKEINKRHKNAFVICEADLRDSATGRAKAYFVHQTCDTVEEVRTALEGHEKWFPYATGSKELPPDLVARMYRNMYHA